MSTKEEEVKKPILYHNWCEPDEAFFKRIDEFGGWPLGMQYVSFYHMAGGPRPCEFGNTELRNEWWTTICSADDYYYWKISDQFKKNLEEENRKKFAREVSSIA